MREQISLWIVDHINQISYLNTEIILLTTLIVISTIVIDALSATARKKRIEVGVDSSSTPVSIDGAEKGKGKQYISDIQGLAGRPDAIIKENGFFIPVETKPLAKKLHDRYVAQLLVYMRLIEEFEGKKPPYGYLLLGPKHRRIKIENSEAKQAWLQQYIDSMQRILAGIEQAVPQPHARKCARCEVRSFCQSALTSSRSISSSDETPDALVAIRASR
jgi:CRISPR-associated protein Cas4